MKKFLAVSLLATMMVFPATVSAAPQNAAAPTTQSEAVVSPEYSTKYVTTQQYYSKIIYPNSFSIPYSYYYNQGGYSGFIYQTSVFDMGSSWWVNYGGIVTSYL